MPNSALQAIATFLNNYATNIAQHRHKWPIKQLQNRCALQNSVKMSMSQWNHGMKQGHEFHVYVAKITPLPSQHLLAVVNIENN